MVITKFFETIHHLFMSGNFHPQWSLFSTDPQSAVNPKFSSLMWHKVNYRRSCPPLLDTVYVHSSLSIPTGACGEHKLGGLWSQ